MTSVSILQGDWAERLKEPPDQSVHCCVTSPPYWGLRDYGVAGQFGLEKTPEEYVAKLVVGFRELRRVLRDDGTLWVNLGDSYCGGGNYRGVNAETLSEKQASNRGANGQLAIGRNTAPPALKVEGLKPKDLVDIPWMVAFALRSDGWYLRSDIIWHKPNPMPESVTDRPTKSHEYIFLLSKSQSYFYDADAIKEPVSGTAHKRQPINGNPASMSFKMEVAGKGNRNNPSFQSYMQDLNPEIGRNKRTVWTVATEAYSEAHFATFPTDLIKPCILAGTSAVGCCSVCGAPWERVVEKVKGVPESFNGSDFRNGKKALCASALADVSQQERTAESRTVGWQPTCDCNATVVPCTVLDPFAGSGTTGQVALELGRSAILIELNPKYCELIKQRTDVTPGLPLDRPHTPTPPPATTPLLSL